MPACFETAHITLHAGVEARIPFTGGIRSGGGTEVVADCVIALPVLGGPRLEGIPCDADGFIPVDDARLVDDLNGVYAIGDATDRPIKQGGLACGQADVTAAHIAVRAGADVEVPPLEQVLRGRLLTGTHDHLLHGETAAEEPTLWAPAKVSGEYLSPYLIANHVVHLPVRSAPAAAGIDVRIPVTREQQRSDAGVLGRSPRGPVVHC